MLSVTPRVPALFDLPSSACRATAPSDFPVRRERGFPVQKFHLLLLSDGKGEELADMKHIIPIIILGAGLFPVADHKTIHPGVERRRPSRQKIMRRQQRRG
ncbi:hypothetical protein GOODEAATRI_000920 [Goodea atripinnis]|uniref:Uncharacterized protein n=1 Tax=Goodea atripinnis TaxID=208336 RepID=A0ABV0NQS4_9TELE